jgi:hypothetical protein
MGRNDQGYANPDKIEKPITRVDLSGSTQMPEGLLSMAPLSKSPTIPTGVVSGPSISADLRSALSSTGGPERRQRVLDVVAKK